MELDEYRAEVLNEVAARREAEGGFSEMHFTEFASEALQSAGIIDSFQLCNFSDVRGKLRIDGYAFDDADDTLMVCVSRWSGLNEKGTMSQAEARSAFSHLSAFLASIASGKYVNFLDVGDAAYDFAASFSERLSSITKIRLYLLTDLALNSRVKDWPEGSVANIPTEYHIWDIARLHTVFESQSGLDEIEISFTHLVGGGLPCLRASLGEADYEGYLAVLPAAELAAIFEQYGSRLLEGNVRSFLSTKGKINQGIRRTLLGNYAMFFAYNNGISCVASRATVVNSNDAILISSITNLQIVNGGQTTASIFNVQRDDHVSTLEETFVPMKLSIVQGDDFSSLMKDISLYANSQNKVTDADLASNDPFQIRFEEMSRQVLAPAVTGAQFSTHWYYERARGQYANEFYKLPSKQREAHRLINPKSQLVTKLDLARVVLCARESPYVIAQGAQRMIMEFSKIVRTGWEKDRQQFNEQYFRDRVAEIITYRQLEIAIVKEEWYIVGYKAIIVAYAMAWLWRKLGTQRQSVDLINIWRSQEAPRGLISVLTLVGQELFAEMTAARDGRAQNTTQLAKRQTCWEDIKSLDIVLPDMSSFLSDNAEKASESRKARQLRSIDDGIEAQQNIVALGSEFWRNMLHWLDKRGAVQALDRSALISASSVGTFPSEKQAQRLLKLKILAEAQGFFADH